MAHSAIQVLSVCQPYAWALIHGKKRVENRSWRTPYKGRLFIHASLGRDYMDSVDEIEAIEEKVLFEEGSNLFNLPHAGLVFGAIIGHVEMVACFDLDDGMKIDPNYAKGPWCWYMRDPKPLATPIPCRGRLQLWEPPEAALIAAGLDYDPMAPYAEVNHAK